MSEHVLHINSVTYVRDYMIRVEFDDGTRKIVDVEPFLSGEVFESLRDQSVFAKVTVDPISKTVVWPNGADLAPEALYDLPAVEDVA